MDNFVVAAIQMDIITNDSGLNLERACQLIDEAAKRGAQVVCLPELFCTGFDYPLIIKQAGLLYAECKRRFCRLAKANNLYLVAGSIAEKAGNRIYNTCLLIDPGGKILGKYRKSHLYPPLDEPKYFSAGHKSRIYATRFGSWGLMLCYDLRFAELGISLGRQGAQILFIPAQFPDPKLLHWRVLLQARAIENQLYVVGINRCGKSPQYSYFGHSLVVDPQGKITAELGREEDILITSIDLNQNRLVRKELYYRE
jgi:omega-amidase